MSLAPLSPGEDTVARWTNNPNNLTDNSVVMDISNEAENTESLVIEDRIILDDLYENAQSITTQDLTTPETNTSSTPLIGENSRKRYRSGPKESQEEIEEKVKEKTCICETANIPPWVKAENALRLSYWDYSRARKLLKNCYTIPDTNNELTCYKLSDNKSLFYVTILCSFFEPQKIIIGCHAGKGGKCEFDSSHLDQVVSALTSIIKGAKSKTINLGVRAGKMKMGLLNESLHFSHIFPSDIKKFVQKNNLAPYLIPEDSYFSLPYSEIKHLLNVLLEAVQFHRLKKDNVTQRTRVFQIAVNDLQQCKTMTPAQFAIKLFEIYYSLNLSPGEKYPISVVLPEYHKMFSNVL